MSAASQEYRTVFPGGQEREGGRNQRIFRCPLAEIAAWIPSVFYRFPHFSSLIILPNIDKVTLLTPFSFNDVLVQALLECVFCFSFTFHFGTD